MQYKSINILTRWTKNSRMYISDFYIESVGQYVYYQRSKTFY